MKKTTHDKNSTGARLRLPVCTGILLAIFHLLWPAMPASAATTNYLNVASVSDGGTYGLDSAYWNTTSETATPLAVYAASDAMCIGTNGSDFSGLSFFILFNYSASTHLTGSGGATIFIGSTNAVVTFTGNDNDYLDAATTIYVAHGSTLIDDVYWNSLGLNFDNQTVTLSGGGVITFQTTIGNNSSGAITENMPGGTVNLVTNKLATDPFTGGYTLTTGELVFTTAASANAFNGFSTKSLNINGGSIDNTSGSPLVLGVGSSTNILGGNFTFVGSTNLDLGLAQVTNTGNHAITVLSNTLAIGGVISGSANGLTKLGPGTLLLYGASTYSGATVVMGGSLALTNYGAIASPLVVSNATFDVSGLANSAISLASLSLSNDPTLVVADQNAPGINIVATNLNLDGAPVTVNVASLPPVIRYPTTFPVLKATTISGTLNFQLGSLPLSATPYHGYISNLTASGQVNLVITNGPASATALTWSGLDAGVSNGTWDVQNTPTWLDSGNQAADFDQGDVVTFNDSAISGSSVVYLAQQLTPSILVVSNNLLPYVFAGGGYLSDGASSLSLSKQGTGSLLLQDSGDQFSGPVNVSGGTVIIDNYSGSIMGGANISPGATMELGNNDTTSVAPPSGTLTVNGALVFNSQNNLTVANSIAGGGVVSQINSNTVLLADGGLNSGNWSVMITNGTLQAADNTALGAVPGGTVTITNGGTFDLAGNTFVNNANFGAKQFNIAGAGAGGNGAIVNSGNTTQEDAFQNIALGADATVSGPTRWDMRNNSPNLNLAGFTLTVTNISQLALVGATVAPGNIIIQQGADLSFQLGCNVNNAGTITANPGGFVGLYESTLGSVKRPIILNGGAITNQSAANTTAYLDSPILMEQSSGFGNAGNSISAIYNGVISDGGNGLSLTFLGGGTNILSAANTYSGNTLVAVGTLALTNHGSIASSPVIIVTNNAAFDCSRLAVPFSGTNALWLGDDVNGAGNFNLGNTLVRNFNYLSLSNAVLQFGSVSPAAPAITVTNLNLGDIYQSDINILGLSGITSTTQFPLIKYVNVTGTYDMSLTLPSGYSGILVNNTNNDSIDVEVTGLPPGFWNGGDSAVDNNWSDAGNWNGSGLGGADYLVFTGTAGLNNTNDTGSETAEGINFVAGAGAFSLNGNPVQLAGGITNLSANPQTINLGLTFGSNGTNYSFAGGNSSGNPLIIGGGLTNAFGSPGYTTLTLAGYGILTNLLNSATSPGGTNVLLLASAGANWSLEDNGQSAATTVPWDFQINAGTFNFGAGSSAPTLTNSSAQAAPQDNQLGDVTGTAGILNMNNGTWTMFARLNTALVNTSTGIVNQAGGVLNIGNQFQGANGSTSNAQSIVNLSGGTLNIVGGTGAFFVASRDAGALNVSGAAALNCAVLDVSRDANGNARGSVGVVNLNGGTIFCGRVGAATVNSQTGPASGGLNPSASFNFNGGTLKANASAANFFQGSTVAPIIPITTTVKSGGAIIDDGGFAISVLEPLQHDGTLGATADGGLTKLGSGSLTLTAASTYTGPTVAGNGTLIVNGALGQSAVTVDSGATLAGSGALGGSVIVNPGGALAPGNPGGLGTLTVAGNVSLQGNTIMSINASTPTNAVLLLSTGALSYGGSLTVTNLGGTPSLGSNFRLFNAPSASGSFSALTLPALPSALAWNWTAANGTLSVVSGGIVPSLSGNILTLSWPSSYSGWTLQCQTNAPGAGLNEGGAWSDVPGSTSVNSVSLPVDPTQPEVFYRLKM